MPKTVRVSRKKSTPITKRRSKNVAASSRAHKTSAHLTNGRKKITPALLQEMTRRLVEEFDPEQVILFGSRAWGKPTRSSDVDLMVIVTTSQEKDYRRILRAYNALGDLIVPTDIFVKTRAEFDFFAEVPASLENAIVRKGKVLYDRSKKTFGTKLANQSAA